MKKSILLIAVICFTVITNQTYSQTRYVDEVFTNVTVTNDVIYGNNISVILAPTLFAQDLLMDVYEPTGDPMTARPLIIYIHSGSLLPIGVNQSTTGDRTDSAVVEMCTQFAKRGYVVGSMTYRMGWNPLEPTLVGRVSGLLNAAYRGIQDTRTCVRYFRMDFENANNYKIDTSRIVVFGQGTGGYLSFGAASLDKVSETMLFKFLDTTGASVINQGMSGDPYGVGGVGLNADTATHIAYSSKIHMAVNLGGAVGDSSWIEAGDVPMVSFHCPGDPFAPYGFGMVVVPTTGENVVMVSGSHDAVRRANYLGNNSILNSATFSDIYTVKANGDGSNVDHLFPVVRTFPESAPWEWWDPNNQFDSTSSITNMDMSPAKGRAYIDTIMGFINPRISCVLNLNPCGTVGTGDSITIGINENAISHSINVYPNPSSSTVTISSSDLIQMVEMYDVTGKVVISLIDINSREQIIQKGNLNEGLYFIRITTESASFVETVMFE